MTITHRDEKLLCDSLGVMSKRDILQHWSQSLTPYADFANECEQLALNNRYNVRIREFLIANPITQETVKTLLAAIAMIANTRWQNTPEIVHTLAHRGWHLGRWLPTFMSAVMPNQLHPVLGSVKCNVGILPLPFCPSNGWFGCMPSWSWLAFALGAALILPLTALISLAFGTYWLILPSLPFAPDP